MIFIELEQIYGSGQQALPRKPSRASAVLAIFFIWYKVDLQFVGREVTRLKKFWIEVHNKLEGTGILL